MHLFLFTASRQFHAERTVYFYPKHVKFGVSRVMNALKRIWGGAAFGTVILS